MSAACTTDYPAHGIQGADHRVAVRRATGDNGIRVPGGGNVSCRLIYPVTGNTEEQGQAGTEE